MACFWAPVNVKTLFMLFYFYPCSCHEIHIDTSGLVSTDTNDDADEEEVFQGHVETLDYSLDPKQRRATVSGGSPTLTRPSIIVDDFELSPVRYRRNILLESYSHQLP